MDDTVLISAQGLSKCYRIYEKPEDRLKQMLVRGRRKYFREFDALKNVNLTIHKGETIGLVGCNGSGKSTLLQIICGTLSPTEGACQVRGRVSALLELGAGFNPDFSGKENIFLNAAILGLSEEETKARYEAIVAFSGLDESHLSQPVRTYSSGMYVRLAFSVATAVDPDILVIDEALAVGDEAFQRKCYGRLKDLKAAGVTILFVSHSAQTILELCDRAVLMDAGEKLAEGVPKKIISDYHRLIFSPREQRDKIRAEIMGEVALTLPESATTETSKPESLECESSIIYSEHGGRIEQISLTDVQQRPVTQMSVGASYCLQYKVRFLEDASQVKFGMMIRTKSGLTISAMAYKGLMDRDFKAGEIYEVRFRFLCRLCPATYFFNVGVTKIVDADEIFVHRIVDAFQCKVIQAAPDNALKVSGIVDLEADCTLVPTSDGWTEQA